MADAPPPPPGFTVDQAATAPPPPPAGFKLDAAAPPPPPGFSLDAAAPAQASTGAKIKDAALAIPRAQVAGIKDIGGEILKEGRQNTEDLKGDFTAPVQSHDKAGRPGAPGFMDYAARAGKTALDVAQRPAIIPYAALRETLGRTAHEVTGGNLDPDAVTNAAMIAYPLSKTKMVSGLLGGGKDAIEKLMSPTTVGKEAGATERIIRRASGESNLQNEKAADKLVQHNKVLANLPVPAQRAVVDAIESGHTPTDPKLAAATKDIRQVYDGWKNRITQVLPKASVPNFITDYYAHMWKENPSVVSSKMDGFSKQGSGRNFKQRTIPTISDGIKAGLTPKYENPIDATMAYSQNMSRYVATHDMMKEMKTQGYAKWYSPGSKNIPPGWVPLDGIMTKKTAPMTKGGTVTGGRPIQLYAPENAARVFNNFVSRGFNANKDVAPIYDTLRKGANGMTMMKLGLSAYHLGTMVNESVISDYARAFRAATRGEFKTAAKAAGGGLANTATLGGKSYMRGLKMQKELLDKAMPDAMSKTVNDAFVRSGGTLKMDPFYRTRASGSFFNAWEKGTVKSELKNAANTLYRGTPWEKAKGTVDLAANVIQSTAAPLFEKYIPMVKRGAFASEMEDFLKSRPGASQAEIDKEAIKIADSIDNRFGELNQDNLFWNKYMKQAAQIALLSPTWTLGTVREIAGGIKDAMGDLPKIAKGEGVSRRTAYIAGLAANTALVNAAYTYLKTGTAPKGRDFMAARTGGTDATSGEPERAMTPGYQKDVYAFGYDFPNHILTESANKLNPALQTAKAVVTNKDYAGHDVFRPEGAPQMPDEGEKFRDFLSDQFLPISLSQFGQKKKGTNLSGVETGLGIRPAPQYITAPERTEALQKKYNTKDWKASMKAFERKKAQQQ